MGSISQKIFHVRAPGETEWREYQYFAAEHAVEAYLSKEGFCREVEIRSENETDFSVMYVDRNVKLTPTGETVPENEAVAEARRKRQKRITHRAKALANNVERAIQDDDFTKEEIFEAFALALEEREDN